MEFTYVILLCVVIYCGFWMRLYMYCWELVFDLYVQLSYIKCTCNTISSTHHYTRFWHTPPCWHAHARKQVVVVAILGLPHVLLFYSSRKRSRKSREGSGDHSLKWDADTFYCHTRICIFNFIIAYFISLYYLENIIVDYLCKTYILNSVIRTYWILLMNVWIIC